jgi:dTDP-4-amino-4,6-dideoxygalactose transaminase
VVEDAAQAIDSYYTGMDKKKKALGTIGHLSAFSFHETKNIQSGEGGLLGINDEQFIKRAEIIWEKGTNRAEFFRGEVNKYGWVDTGSSFLPSEITAAFLWAQLEYIDEIQAKRKSIWEEYYSLIAKFNSGLVALPYLPEFASNNAHMFYLVCKTPKVRANLISWFKENSIHAVFHYLSLHSSPYYHLKHDGRKLPNTDFFSETLIRLPLFYELNSDTVRKIVRIINDFPG